MAKKSQSPEFDIEDLKVGDEPVSESVQELEEAAGISHSHRSEIDKIRSDISRLYKMVDNKGLEVGLPNIIIFDIGEISTSISGIRNLLASEGLKEKWNNEDNEIRKKLKSGNEIPAYFDKEMQVNELRSAIYKLDSFLYDLTNRLKRLQSRMQGKEIHDYED